MHVLLEAVDGHRPDQHLREDDQDDDHHHRPPDLPVIQVQSLILNFLARVVASFV